MTHNAFGAAVLTAATLAIPHQALARAAAPLVPAALVEEVKSVSAGIEFMEYVGAGEVIKLEPSDVLVLSYLKSCEHETITGGTVRVGLEKSEVEGGKVVRSKVPCNGGHGGFYDLAKTDARLRRGTLYTATVGSRTVTFKVDAKAKTGKTPVVSRLLRFPPG
jgi:hypothetical protein